LLSESALHRVVEELVHLAREGDIPSLVRVLDDCIPGASVRSEPPPDITSII
jgi:hypothetical protein